MLSDYLIDIDIKIDNHKRENRVTQDKITSKNEKQLKFTFK